MTSRRFFNLESGDCWGVMSTGVLDSVGSLFWDDNFIHYRKKIADFDSNLRRGHDQAVLQGQWYRPPGVLQH